MKNLYLLSKICLLLSALALSVMMASCGQKGDLVHPVAEEETPSQAEESK